MKKTKSQRKNERIEKLENELGQAESRLSIALEELSAYKEKYEPVEQLETELNEWRERLEQEDLELQQKLAKFEKEQEDKTLKKTRRRLEDRGRENQKLRQEIRDLKKDMKEVNEDYQSLARQINSKSERIDYYQHILNHKQDTNTNTRVFLSLCRARGVIKELMEQGVQFTDAQIKSIEECDEVIGEVVTPVAEPTPTKEQNSEPTTTEATPG